MPSKKKKRPGPRENDKEFILRLPQEDYDQIEELAYSLDMSVTEWMRRQLRTAMRRAA